MHYIVKTSPYEYKLLYLSHVSMMYFLVFIATILLAISSMYYLDSFTLVKFQLDIEFFSSQKCTSSVEKLVSSSLSKVIGMTESLISASCGSQGDDSFYVNVQLKTYKHISISFAKEASVLVLKNQLQAVILPIIKSIDFVS